PCSLSSQNATLTYLLLRCPTVRSAVRGGLNDRHVKIVCPNCALRTSAITDEFKRKLINEKDLMVVRALEALRDGVRATLLKAADEVGDTNRLRIAVRAGLLRLAAGRHGTNLQARYA
ncbi:hypothetical protein SARC_15071, partial [Sphaeroforma arctica JP610]